jgi:homoserine O-acetyltransferase
MSKALQPDFEGDFTSASGVPFELEAGGKLQPLTLRYARYGAVNARRDNVVLVCHALSGSARVAEWWPEMFAPEGPFDLEKYCIIGVNVLGSCYGSTGPSSIDQHSGRPYGGDFPAVGIGDMVRAQAMLLGELGVEKLHAVIGGSIGGLQALEWAVRFANRVQRCVAIGACPLSTMGLALSHLQRQAIRNDPAWRGGHYAAGEQPAAGLALARGIAMCTYKSAELFQARFGRRPNRNGEQPHLDLHHRFDVGGYLDHQGQIFVDRFDANSYLVLSKAMDTFQFGRDAGEEAATLRRIRAKVLLVGIQSDWLFPPEDVRELAKRMRGVGVDASYEELATNHGHDGFLAEGDRLGPLMMAALREPCPATLVGAVVE